MANMTPEEKRLQAVLMNRRLQQFPDARFSEGTDENELSYTPSDTGFQPPQRFEQDYMYDEYKTDPRSGRSSEEELAALLGMSIPEYVAEQKRENRPLTDKAPGMNNPAQIQAAYLQSLYGENPPPDFPFIPAAMGEPNKNDILRKLMQGLQQR